MTGDRARVWDAARRRLIVALDLPSAREALELADRIRPHAGCFKVGLELFVAEGPQLVRQIASRGLPVFLDLKLHDIPATVSRAARAACELGVHFLSVHAGDSEGGLRAAVEAVGRTGCKILAITVLTSVSGEDLAAPGQSSSVDDLVRARAGIAARCGCAGVVCSARETELVGHVGGALLRITPGIRPRGASRDDQRRVVTPAEAIAAGADMIVVGRPIRDATDPAEAARAVVEQIAQAAGSRAAPTPEPR